MPNDDYYAIERLSNSGMTHLKRSPAHYIASRSQNFDTPAMRFGRIVHTAILEPEKLNIAVFDGDKRTKAGKEAYAELLAGGTEIVTQEENDKIFSMRDAVYRAFEITGETEKQVFWTDESGAECKAKADILQDRIIWDLKTTQDASDFAWTIGRYDYDRQAAFYTDGFKAQDFGWIVVEKEPPFGVRIIIASHATLEAGREKYKPLAALYAQCVMLDEWPSYSNNVEII